MGFIHNSIFLLKIGDRKDILKRVPPIFFPEWLVAVSCNLRGVSEKKEHGINMGGEASSFPFTDVAHLIYLYFPHQLLFLLSRISLIPMNIWEVFAAGNRIGNSNQVFPWLYLWTKPNISMTT